MTHMQRVSIKDRLLDHCLQHAGELICAGTAMEKIEIKEEFSTYYVVMVENEVLFEVWAEPGSSGVTLIKSQSKHAVIAFEGWEEWFPPFTRTVL